MPASQIIGFTPANIAEVEAASRAMRMTLRPRDWGSLGSYSVGGVSGVMAANLGSNKSLFAFRWASANVCVVRRVIFTVATDTVAFTLGVGNFRLAFARSFTASASGGTSLLPSGNQNKMRTSMGTTLAADIRIATTTGLTDGTWTDVNLATTTNAALQCLMGYFPAAAGKSNISPRGDGADGIQPCEFLDERPGEYPIVLRTNEGIVIQTDTGSVPATGTWRFGVEMRWEEFTAYP